MNVGFKSFTGLCAQVGVEKPAINTIPAMMSDRTMSFFIFPPLSCGSHGSSFTHAKDPSLMPALFCWRSTADGTSDLLCLSMNKGDVEAIFRTTGPGRMCRSMLVHDFQRKESMFAVSRIRAITGRTRADVDIGNTGTDRLANHSSSCFCEDLPDRSCVEKSFSEVPVGQAVCCLLDDASGGGPLFSRFASPAQLIISRCQ